MLQPPNTPCKQGLVWDHDLTYSTQAFFCEAAKICKLLRNKRNRPICTCVLQTHLNDTVQVCKSLQVLISGNLCLKVKHFSSSGPILVTAQPLSVTCNLLAYLMRDVLQTQNATREQKRPKRFKGPFLSPDERQKSLQRKLWHQPTSHAFKKQAEHTQFLLSVGGGREENRADLTKPYRIVKFHL